MFMVPLPCFLINVLYSVSDLKASLFGVHNVMFKKSMSSTLYGNICFSLCKILIANVFSGSGRYL